MFVIKLWSLFIVTSNIFYPKDVGTASAHSVWLTAGLQEVQIFIEPDRRLQAAASSRACWLVKHSPAGLLISLQIKTRLYYISHLTAQSLWTIMISLHLFHYDRSSVTEIENHKLSVKVYQPKEKQIYVWCVCRHNRKRNLYLFISSILYDTPFIQCVHVIYTAKMYLQ